MTRLRANLVANFSGQISANLIQLAIIPVYVRYLGIAAYGLVGVQLTLQTLSQALDLGLSPTINRELARYSAVPEQAAEARDFVRTLELGYWLVGGFIGLGVWWAAPWIADRWLHGSTVPEAVVRESIRVMAIGLAAQWPLTFYRGGLLGLQRHAVINVVRVAMTAVSAVGAYILLARISPTVTALLRWQVAVSVVWVAVLTNALWRNLPKSGRPARFHPSLARGVWRFAAGVSAITVTALVLGQLDKIVLSRILPLEQFGYYVLGGIGANAVYAMFAPMFASMFPEFSRLAARGETGQLQGVYRRMWGLMAVLIVPAAAVLATGSHDLLLVWTRDPAAARIAGPITAALVVGMALNGLMNVPYALQLACGWTRLAVWVNLLLCALVVPAVIVLAQRYGAVGAALVWPALNALYMALALPVTHRRLRAATGTGWLGREIAIPVCGSIVTALACRALLPRTADPFSIVGEAMVTWTLSAAVLVAASSELRGRVKPYAARGIASVRHRLMASA